MSMIACDACDAFNSSKASVCIECGERLGAGDALRSAPEIPAASSPRVGRGDRGKAAAPPDLPGATKAKRGKSRRQRDPADVERSRKRQEFGRIKNIVFTVRSVYWSGVVFAVVQLLLYHLILSPAFVELELPVLQVVVGIISWGQLALLVTGARQVVKKPYLWTVIGAAYWTFGTAQAFWVASLGDWLLLQDTRFFAYLTMMSFMLVAFWFSVAQAKRVQRLMDENPELQLQRKRLDPEERSYGGVAEEAAARRSQERKRSHAMQLRIILVGAGVLVLGGGGVWAMTRPESPETAAADFQELWLATDKDAIYSECADGAQGSVAESFQEAMEQRGWHLDRPKLGDVEVDGSEKRATTVFPCEGDELVVGWRTSETGWKVVSTAFPDLVVGDIHEGVAEFEKAWAASGVDALTAMIREDSYKIEYGIRNIFKRREWLEARPKLGRAHIGEVMSRGRVRVTFNVADKSMRVTLRYWHPGWKIAGFSLR